jgi:pyruvate,water dikinase
VNEVLDGDWDPVAHWSTTNVSEAVPGVPTPLNWTFWRPPFERTMRGAFGALGALERTRIGDPTDPHERMFGIFHGRVAAKVEFLGEMGDRLPGTSGAAIAEQFLGELPPGFASTRTWRRYPVIAARMPYAALAAPRRAVATRRATQRWWSAELAGIEHLPLDAARQEWQTARGVFERAFFAHVLSNLVCVQPVHDQLRRLTERAGHPELAARIVAGQGAHTETAVVEDCWALSRDRIALAEFLARHGYHGPNEGELSSRMWREDPSPVLALRELYRAKPDSDSPSARQARLAADARRARATLLAALPRHERPVARMLLAAGHRYLGLRGVGKSAFVQALDGARAIARQLGALLAADGTLSAPEDVFYLTADELSGELVAGSTGDLVDKRREERDRDLALRLPLAWRGRPEVQQSTIEPADEHCPRLTGIGASPGVVEARVRVILDPGDAHVEPGEILVVPTTDPSWAPIMFASSALVVDIGGMLSHAAVIARELGIPCVMGTGEGTRRMRTGDLCRVDGQAGTALVTLRCKP